jgi:hypothetical protein
MTLSTMTEPRAINSQREDHKLSLDTHRMQERAPQFDATRWAEARQPRSTITDGLPDRIIAMCQPCSSGPCCCKPSGAETFTAKLLCS